MENLKLNWIQIPAIDLIRASTFYTNVFGSSFFFEKLNDIEHAVFQADSKGDKLINGALIEIKEGETVGLGVTLFFDATGNFDLLLEKIESNGGEVITPKTLIKKPLENNDTILVKTYIDNRSGYFAHFFDSEGNKIGLYGSN